MLEMENDNIPFKKWFFFICDISIWGGCNLPSFEICGTFKKGDASPFKEGDTSLEDPGLLMGSDLPFKGESRPLNGDEQVTEFESPGMFVFFSNKKFPSTCR